MKTKEQIQQAHDVLHAVIEFDMEQKERMAVELFVPMHAAHDALSWVLEGPCKGPFEDNLKMLQEKMDKAGYRLVKRNDQSHSE
jgi:hypothetical protein